MASRGKAEKDNGVEEWRRHRREAVRERLLRPAELIAAALAALYLLYLALRQGGYELVVFGEAAAVLWFALGAGLVLGTLPAARPSREARALLIVLAALAAWTALAMIWTASEEGTAAEAVRVASLLGLAALLVLLPGRRPAPLLAAVGASGAVVAAAALLSRFQPGLFSPSGELIETLPGTLSRLSFPVDYWNALAILLAITTPPLLALAASARSRTGAAAAAGAAAAMVLAAYYTLSRGGLGALALALAVLVALHPRRLALLRSLAPTAAGAAVLIWAAERRDSLADGLTTEVAKSQGDAMMAITIAVVAVVAIGHYWLAKAAERGLLPRPRIALRPSARVAAAVGVLVVAAGLVAGAPGEAADRWEEFKQPRQAGEGSARLAGIGGRGRYQWWSAATEAGRSEPLLGIGPGSYELYWSREGTLAAPVEDAHSLYLESFAELGLPGLALVLVLVGGVLVAGARIAASAPTRERAVLAGAVAGCAAFALGAGLDWAWELTALPAAFVTLAAVLARYRRDPSPPAADPLRPALRIPAGAGAIALAALILLPTLSAAMVNASQDHAEDGRLQAALSDAERAGALAPWAATPLLQQALVLELAGQLQPAARLAREAAGAEPTNWQLWLTLARIEADRGRARAALEAFERAQSLNPRSPLFEGSPDRAAQPPARPSERR